MQKANLLWSVVLLLGCDLSAGGSSCEEARLLIQNLIHDTCESAEYQSSPFCTCCVANGYYSIDADCNCRDLIFDAETCLYANGDQGRPAVRAAIEYANSQCSSQKVGLPVWEEPPTVEWCELRGNGNTGGSTGSTQSDSTGSTFTGSGGSSGSGTTTSGGGTTNTGGTGGGM
ncbi:MAG: hypothetical protein IPK82_29880 [Polyangiaceae bacterium]|nr:hypothetical protein [Polyangiaceae bacterium]